MWEYWLGKKPGRVVGRKLVVGCRLVGKERRQVAKLGLAWCSWLVEVGSPAKLDSGLRCKFPKAVDNPAELVDKAVDCIEAQDSCTAEATELAMAIEVAEATVAPSLVQTEVSSWELAVELQGRSRALEWSWCEGRCKSQF